MNIHEWNKKVYWNEDGTRAEGGLGAEEFWEEFQIPSWPKFRDACAYHIPAKWADDVRLFLTQTRNELGDRVEFRQIKEKFCYFTVYFDSKDEEARTRMYELIHECIDRLTKKGVHPQTGEKE